MFVKHITDKDIFEHGFILNPVMNETFSREKIDTKFISTNIQVWIDINSYRYKVSTDREGAVEYGRVLSRKVLENIVRKFFENDVESFLRRNIPKKYPHLNDTMISCMLGSLSKMSAKEKENTMLRLFGENYAQ